LATKVVDMDTRKTYSGRINRFISPNRLNQDIATACWLGPATPNTEGA
jgi:hypothetical protein